MARTAGSDGERTEAAIREAAAPLIAHHGFEAVTMRQLAAEVGVQAAALYRYFPAKEDLLFKLMRDHMEGLAESLKAALPANGGPRARLARLERACAALPLPACRRHDRHARRSHDPA